MQAACDSHHIKNYSVLEFPSCNVDYSPAVVHARTICLSVHSHTHEMPITPPRQCYIFVETRGEEALDILWGDTTLMRQTT